MRNARLFGHMAFLNLKSLVEPLYTGFRETQWTEDYPANYVQAAKAKAQGAVNRSTSPSQRRPRRVPGGFGSRG